MLHRKQGLEIKREILFLLKDKRLSLRALETKIIKNNNTIKTHCEELEFFGIIRLVKHTKNELNGRPYVTAELTEQGKKIKS